MYTLLVISISIDRRVGSIYALIYSIIVITDREENTFELNICIQTPDVHFLYEHSIERCDDVGFKF